MNTNTKWIGPDENLSVGDVGFLIEISPERGDSRWILRDLPACTNLSREITLNGWCGSYNNVSTNAHGVARVIRVAKNDRCLVQNISGDELAAALEELGYPELV